MRIIAGSLKGRRLAGFEGEDIRPTSDRTRESIFNLLMHGQFAGDNIIGQRVADLCCGTGALGLEAISRGAHSCIFVDQSKKALALAKDNALHCNVVNQAHFLQADITRLPPTTAPVALVMLDAPYASPLLPAAYAALKQQSWFAPDALLVVEQPRDATVPELEGAELLVSRQYGKPVIHIWRVA